MTAIYKKLLWKEFHELKWGTAGAAAVVLAIPLTYVFRDVSMALMGVMTDLWAYPLLGGIFFGMRAAAGERTSRAASFVAALPVSHRLLGVTRLSSTLMASIVPLFILLALAWFLNPQADESARMTSNQLLAVFGASLLATMLCISIVAAAGSGQPSEIRAGLVGFVAILITWFVGYMPLIFLCAFLQHFFWEQYAVPQISEEWAALVSVLIVIATNILVARVFTRRYSQALGPFADPSLKGWKSRKRWKTPEWRMRIFSDQVAALIGKAVREMGLLGSGVLGVSLLLSVLAGSLDLTTNDRAVDLSSKIIGALPGILLIGGYVLAILVGVGAVIEDVQPAVNTFWRSRPISARAWYWTKYAVGLATMLLAVGIPALLFVGSNAEHITGQRGVFWWLLMWNLTFSFALTATCLVRQPGYAAILAIGAVSVLYAVIESTFGSFMPNERAAPMEILAPVFIVAFIASTMLGSWAAVKDVSVA